MPEVEEDDNDERRSASPPPESCDVRLRLPLLPELYAWASLPLLLLLLLPPGPSLEDRMN